MKTRFFFLFNLTKLETMSSSKKRAFPPSSTEPKKKKKKDACKCCQVGPMEEKCHRCKHFFCTSCLWYDPDHIRMTCYVCIRTNEDRKEDFFTYSHKIYVCCADTYMEFTAKERALMAVEEYCKRLEEAKELELPKEKFIVMVKDDEKYPQIYSSHQLALDAIHQLIGEELTPEFGWKITDIPTIQKTFYSHSSNGCYIAIYKRPLN